MTRLNQNGIFYIYHFVKKYDSSKLLFNNNDISSVATNGHLCVIFRSTLTYVLEAFSGK